MPAIYDPSTDPVSDIQRSIDNILGILLLLRQDVDQLKGSSGTTTQLTLRAPLAQQGQGTLPVFDGAGNAVSLVPLPLGTTNGMVLTVRKQATLGMDWLPSAVAVLGLENATISLLPRP